MCAAHAHLTQTHTSHPHNRPTTQHTWSTLAHQLSWRGDTRRWRCRGVGAIRRSRRRWERYVRSDEHVGGMRAPVPRSSSACRRGHGTCGHRSQRWATGCGQVSHRSRRRHRLSVVFADSVRNNISSRRVSCVHLARIQRRGQFGRENVAEVPV